MTRVRFHAAATLVVLLMVVLARPAWSSVPDEGMRGLPAVLVPCDDLGSPGDVDRPEDLA